jgi:hypothetical protein
VIARLHAGLLRFVNVPLVETITFSALLLSVSMSQAAGANVDPAAMDPRLPNFIKAKEQQARTLAKDLQLTVNPRFWKVFNLLERGDRDAGFKEFNRLVLSNGQYQGSSGDDKTLRSPVWQTLLDAEASCALFASGDPKLAREFGDGIISGIPPGSVYFGGSDPGRCLVTALCKSHADGDPFFTITQNPLVDENYLTYLREMYGGKLYIPTTADSQNCFNTYVLEAEQRAKEHRAKPGEMVREVDGRATVSGMVAVMGINGLIAKTIFDKNPHRDFYIEQSFPLDWMYPRLVPRGLILRIERMPPKELSPEIIQRDQDYWRNRCGALIGDWITEKTTVEQIRAFAQKVYHQANLTDFKGDPKFVTDTNAQKAFSMLRCSIGGVYSWRANAASSDTERQRMTSAADLAYRQAFALCPGAYGFASGYSDLLLRDKRLDDALTVARTAKESPVHYPEVEDLLNRLLEMKRKTPTAPEK